MGENPLFHLVSHIRVLVLDSAWQLTLLRLMILTHYSLFTCLTTCWYGGSKRVCLLVSIILWNLNLVFLF